MKFFKKRGFTVVELVIVIAVIGILAAVLIPTFTYVVKRSNTVSDTQLIRNLNVIVQGGLDELGQNNYDTPHDAFETCFENGYDVTKIVAKSSYNIAYDYENARFVLLNTETNKYIYAYDLDTIIWIYVHMSTQINRFLIKQTLFVVQTPLMKATSNLLF